MLLVEAKAHLSAPGIAGSSVVASGCRIVHLDTHGESKGWVHENMHCKTETWSARLTDRPPAHAVVGEVS